MNLTVDTHFQLFPWGFRRRYTGNTAIPQHAISTIADRLITTFLPTGALSAAPLTNYKGRDILTPRLLHADAFPRSQGDELLYIAGSIQISDSDTMPFFVSITTTFKEFVGSDVIVHLPTIHYSPELPGYLPLKYVARVIPLTITYVRLGFDFFTPKLSAALLGFTPTPTERINLEMNSQEIAVEIIGEGYSSCDREPLKGLEIVGKLGQLINV